MAAKKTDYHPDASLELGEALEWYRLRSESAAAGFVHEIERCIARIAAAPQAAPKFRGEVRRQVLHRYPFAVLFRDLPDRIEIVAVAHHKRRPFYWRAR